MKTLTTAKLEQPALSLDELATLWRQTKAAEEQHRKDRVGLEEAMLHIVSAKEEGSETTKTDHYKITTTARMIRSMDWKKWDTVKDSVAENLRPVKMKPELDVTGCKYLADNEPDVWRVVAQCITTKPGKVGFKVEPVGDA